MCSLVGGIYAQCIVLSEQFCNSTYCVYMYVGTGRASTSSSASGASVLGIATVIMKGTKVLTLGAGRAPQHGGYKDVYTPSSYTHAIHVYLRMRGTVNWWAGLSITVSYQLAESRSQGSYTTR